MIGIATKHWAHQHRQAALTLCCLIVVTVWGELLMVAEVAYAQSGPLNFSLRTLLPVADDTNALAVGDFNGDGALDLVVGNNGLTTLYANDGSGNFVTATTIGSAMQTVDVVVGDVNDDGALDLVVYTLQTPSRVYLNNGQGALQPATTFPAAAGVLDQLALGDIDGDRDLDLIASRETGSSSIYLNNGQGAFAEAATLRAGLNPFLIDQDGDGDLDLFLIHADTLQPAQSRLSLYKNNGTGSFQGTTLTLNGSKGFENRFAVGDIDGDGDLDYVISSYKKSGCTEANCEDLRLLLNRGLLGFGSVRLDTAGVSDLALVDLDHDGDLDLATSSLAFSTQQAKDRQSKVYFNNGVNELLLSAAFVAQEIGPAETTARTLEVADLDADGLPDFVLGGVGADAIYQNHNLLFETCQLDLLLLHPQLVADLNGDGDLDIIQRSGLLRENDGKGNFTTRLILPVTLDLASLLTTADFNGDGRLDLLTAHPTQPAVIYLQSANGLFLQGAVLDQESTRATSLAIGDLNGDGTLDLLIGRGTQPGSTTGTPATSRLYFNNGAAQFTNSRALDSANETQAVAFADLDTDGDLDIVVANSQELRGQEQGKQNWLYFNDGTGNFPEKRALGTGADRTRALAVGDLNGDSYVDLVLGNYNQPHVLYYNDGNGRFDQGQPLGQLLAQTGKILLLDLDHDRDLDLIAANEQQADSAYINDGKGRFSAVAAFGEPFVDARLLTVAAGDLDADGDLDIVAEPQQLSLLPYVSGCWMKGRLAKPLRTSDRLPQLVVRQPGNTAGAAPYASPTLFAQRTISIPFTLYDPEAKPVDLRVYYSLDGGGQWLPAHPTTETPTRRLATLTNNAPVPYTFIWDVYASNVWGQSDNVLLRLEVQPSTQPARNRKAAAYRYPYVAAQTTPFRVRGTQVRVLNAAGSPVAGAALYRLPVGATSKAELYPVRNSLNLRTNAQGYLPGRGALALGDQLVALAPISATHAFTLYHTSAIPSPLGLNSFTVNAAGIQTLTVSSANSLLLFNLDLSVEWDARNDGAFLADLANAIQHSSEVLFDVTEGQVALGEVNVYQAKERWSSADIVLYASNSLQPRASMGGVVITPTHDIGLQGVITDAYLPGQVRMGPLWDPFGQSEAELRQDWWLALAHELSHYLFFLPDNYLGIENGFLVKIDCQGSFMTSTYEEPYREFLTRDRWDAQEPCRTKTMAAHTTGRADWETIQRFLPWLRAPQSSAAVNPGPATMPLNVTQIRFVKPGGLPRPPALPARNFDLRNGNTGEVIQVRQAAAYLFKTQGTPQLEDDTILALGDTGAGSDRIKVRGATAGDRLCLIAGQSTPVQVGCETLTANSTSVRLGAVPGWQPDLVVSPITSRTLLITVTQPLSPGLILQAQVLPAYAPPTQTSPSGVGVSAPWVVLQPDNPANPRLFTQQITLDAPAFEGFVRLWVAGDSLGREAISEFFLSTGWGPNNRRGFGTDNQVWGPNNRRGFGPNNRRGFGAANRVLGAPFASGDGKVTIFEMTNIVGYMGQASLQALPTLPNLPLWLSPVGAGYRFQVAEPMERTIAFNYLEREAPKGYEQTLTLYYLPADAQPGDATAWQRLPTDLDTGENLAAARMPQNAVGGQGIYALLATVEMPALTPGWNLFAYVIPGTRPVAPALASLAGAYTAVYEHAPSAPVPWRLYDATVTQQHPDLAGLVNDLPALEFGHAYWLYATDAVTPYLGVALPAAGAQAASNGELPPATFYGPLDSAGIVVPTVGMPVTAAIDGVACGNGTVAQVNGQWVYKVQVTAAVANNGCGVLGATVKLGIGGYLVAQMATWDHRQAQYQPVTVVDTPWPAAGALIPPTEQLNNANQIFLPMVAR